MNIKRLENRTDNFYFFIFTKHKKLMGKFLFFLFARCVLMKTSVKNNIGKRMRRSAKYTIICWETLQDNCLVILLCRYRQPLTYLFAFTAKEVSDIEWLCELEFGNTLEALLHVWLHAVRILRLRKYLKHFVVWQEKEPLKKMKE